MSGEGEAAAGVAGEENSQAEGQGQQQPTEQGAVGQARNNNPLYENVRGGNHHHHQAGGVAAGGNINNNNNSGHVMGQMDRGGARGGYDVVPARNRVTSATTSSMTRRANLHLSGLNGGAGNASRGRNFNSYQQQPVYYGGSTCPRQHSFDDTESAHYHQVVMGGAGGSSTYRYENLYEQIREEPIYKNVPGNGGAASGSKVYGRLDVIGHGIGRIERHLSSSCGNIDHYNLGGHYAVMGHPPPPPHVNVPGTVGSGTGGHVRVNSKGGGSGGEVEKGTVGASAAVGGNKDGTVKSSYSSFFNCLSKENSQSMMNMERTGMTLGGHMNSNNIQSSTSGVVDGGAAGVAVVLGDEEGAVGVSVEKDNKMTNGKETGAIPKVATTTSTTATVNDGAGESGDPSGGVYGTSPSPVSLNKLTKSSMQWLMMNKWLPLWMGQGTDCRVIDFNFMFSRKCDGCGENCGHGGIAPSGAGSTVANLGDTDEELLRQFAADDERNVLRSYSGNNGHPAQFWTPHPTHRTLYGANGWNDGRLSLRGAGGMGVHDQWPDQRHYDVPRATGRFARDQFLRETGNRRCAGSGGGRWGRERPESPNMSRVRGRGGVGDGWSRRGEDPFRNWELNVENNTFKPANNRVQDVRRITDGTYRRKDVRRGAGGGQLGGGAVVNGGRNGMPGLGTIRGQGSETEDDRIDDSVMGLGNAGEDDLSEQGAGVEVEVANVNGDEQNEDVLVEVERELEEEPLPIAQGVQDRIEVVESDRDVPNVVDTGEDNGGKK